MLSLALHVDNESVSRLRSTQSEGQYGDVRMLYTPLRDGVEAEAMDAMLTAVEMAVERVSSVATDTVAVGQVLTPENAMTLLPFVVGIRRMFNVAHQWLIDTPTLLTNVLANCLTNDVGYVLGSGSSTTSTSRDATNGSDHNHRTTSTMSLEQVTILPLVIVLPPCRCPAYSPPAPALDLALALISQPYHPLS